MAMSQICLLDQSTDDAAFCCLVEGPCLLHTTTGNLLRTLPGPGECVRPRLLKLTRDGLVLVNYTDGTGHLAVFTVNGRLLSEKKLDDQMLVRNVVLIFIFCFASVSVMLFLTITGLRGVPI